MANRLGLRILTIAMLAVAGICAANPARVGAADAPTAPLPVEAFAELPFLSSPLLSPDGTRIAARVTADERERIAIWTLSAPRSDPPRMLNVSQVESFSWAGDGRLLFTYSGTLVLNFGSVAFPLATQRIAVHDLESGKTATLGEFNGLADEVIFTDPAGRYVLLSGQSDIDETPSVHRIDLETGEMVQVQPPRRGVWNWFADAGGVVRVGVDYGERRTRIYYRATAESELRLVDNQRNRADESVIDLVRFVDRTDRGVIVTNAETGRFAVYDYDFATDTRGAVLFAHDEVDVSSAIFAVDGSVDGVLYEDDRQRVRWLNPDMARLQQRIDATLPGYDNWIVNRSRDGNRVLIFSTSAADPGTWYIFDQAARRLEIFASPYEGLQGREFAPVRPVRYTSRDGLIIHGYLTLPPGRPERDLPLVVLPHGGPFLRDSWIFNPEVQFLTSRGYAVLQPNFRGSTGYGRQFVERGYGQLGTGMIDDLDDGVRWLAEQDIVDEGRVCIMGSSYGGYAAIWAAMRSPDRYRCAISWAGPTDLRAMLRYDLRSFIPRRYARTRRRELRGDEEADLAAVSPLRQAERLAVPLLIGHGEQDVRVPIDQSRDLVRALTRRGVDVESIFYPKSGHDFGTPADSADFLRRVEDFLARHNPAHADAPSASGTAAVGDGVSIPPSSR